MKYLNQIAWLRIISNIGSGINALINLNRKSSKINIESFVTKHLGISSIHILQQVNPNPFHYNLEKSE